MSKAASTTSTPAAAQPPIPDTAISEASTLATQDTTQDDDDDEAGEKVGMAEGAEGKDATTLVLTEILTERKRQIEKEGHSLEADDYLDDGQLANAAGCYARFSTLSPEDRAKPMQNHGFLMMFWKFAAAAWKPKTRRADLIRAAALLVAEIERLDRRPH